LAPSAWPLILEEGLAMAHAFGHKWAAIRHKWLRSAAFRWVTGDTKVVAGQGDGIFITTKRPWAALGPGLRHRPTCGSAR